MCTVESLGGMCQWTEHSSMRIISYPSPDFATLIIWPQESSTSDGEEFVKKYFAIPIAVTCAFLNS